PEAGLQARRSMLLFQRDAAQQIEVREHLPRAENDRRQRIFCELDGKPGFLAQSLVEIPEQRPAACEDDPAVEDVCRQLRWNPLERVPDRLTDRAYRVAERLPDLLVVHPDGLRPSLAEVTPFHLDREVAIER